MRISDWSSDVCSSGLLAQLRRHVATVHLLLPCGGDHIACRQRPMEKAALQSLRIALKAQILLCGSENDALRGPRVRFTDRHEISRSHRSEEHTSELQSLMRNSYAVFGLKQKTKRIHIQQTIHKDTVNNLS